MITNNWLFFSTTGAGYHSESKAKEYKHVCKRACQKVWAVCLVETLQFWPESSFTLKFEILRFDF